MRQYFLRGLFALLGVAALGALVATEADARAGSGGSRGARTFSAPPPTATAPRAAPLNRSMTQPGQPGQPGAAATRPNAPAAQQGGLFGRPGFLGGLAAGFLGAGLIGMLMGHGFGGGLAGIASFLGLLLQVGLVAMVAMLAWRWWQRRNAPAVASGPSLRDNDLHRTPEQNQNRLSALGLGGLRGQSGLSPRPAAAPAFGEEQVAIGQEDYDSFERLLGELQTAYSAEDLTRLRKIATPEMVSYFAEDLAANASRGVANKIGDVKLLQGDLSEAWREGDSDYATVAMRYSIDDRLVQRDSGRELEGGPQEVTEFWTFRRARPGDWMVSAIQAAE